jgi:hypothetical protein
MQKAFAILVNREGFGVPWHRSELENQIAPVRRRKLCREAQTNYD